LNQRISPVPYLGYSTGAYFSRMANLILSQTKPSLKLERRYETDMAEGLKAMALQGHGVAFLPDSAVLQELKRKRLVLAGEHAPLVMQVRLYRLRPAITSTTATTATVGRSKKGRGKAAMIDDLWQHLAQTPTASETR
jgi:LysR family transcriptional regulator, hypochlorite-specific transcription factor HypT